jgi:hypothetical protein
MGTIPVHAWGEKRFNVNVLASANLALAALLTVLEPDPLRDLLLQAVGDAVEHE